MHSRYSLVRREISSGDSSISEHPPDQPLHYAEQHQPVVVHEEHVDYESSDDSFHSTIEYLGDQPLVGL